MSRGLNGGCLLSAEKGQAAMIDLPVSKLAEAVQTASTPEDLWPVRRELVRRAVEFGTVNPRDREARIAYDSLWNLCVSSAKKLQTMGEIVQ
jgi:hypothetical protein